MKVWTVYELAGWAGAWHLRAHSWVLLQAARGRSNMLGLGAGGAWHPPSLLLGAMLGSSSRCGDCVCGWHWLPLLLGRGQVVLCGLLLGRGQVVLCGLCLAEVRSCSLRSAWRTSWRRRRLLQLLVGRARYLRGALVLQVRGRVFQLVLKAH